MKHTKLLFASSASVLAGLLSGYTATAQNADGDSVALEEITITAEKRESNLQKTAISIVALVGEDIDREGRNDIRDLLSTVAGVNFSNAAFGATSINLRGIEGITAAAGKTDPGVSLNFDGVVASNLIGDAGSSAFFDVARVEVLRGPQGTLYGRGAEAGVINVVSNNPGKEFDLAGTLEVGSYKLQRTSGVINIPLGDSWAIRAAYNGIQRDGYYTSGLSDLDVSASRVKLRYDAGGSFTALLGTEYTLTGGALGSGGMGAGITSWGLGDPPTDPWDDVTKNGGATGQVPGSTRNNKLLKLWSQVDWSTGVGDLTVLPSYTSTLNKSVIVAVGATPFTYLQQPGLTDADAKSVEARFSSPADAKFKWVLGAYYDTAKSFVFTQQFTRNTWQDQSSLAGFAQATYPISDKWSVTGGLRQTKDEKSFISERTSGALRHTDGEKSWSRTDWKLGVENQLTPDTMLYFTAATGYRPGGVDSTATTTVTTPTGAVIPNNALFSKPEYLTTFEVGTKNELLNKRLRLNANAYYYDYKDRQFTYFITTADPAVPCPNGARPDAFPPDVVCNVMLNIEKVRTMGAELETLWLFTEHDRANLSLSYTDSKGAKDQTILLSIPAGATQTGSYAVNVNGKTTPRTPKLQANAYYEHGFELPGGTLSLRGDARYTSESYISGFNYLLPVTNSAGFREGDRYIIEANTRYDASLKFEADSGKWSLNFYGKNLTNEAVKSDTNGSVTNVEAPRTIGVVLSAKM
ncbi:MAG: TonB-dependent receptor [Steroidobacteraceae bacterium]